MTAMAEEAMIEEKANKAVEARFAEAFANCDDLAEEVVKAKIDEELDVIIKNQIIKQKLDRETRKMVNEEVEKSVSTVIKEVTKETDEMFIRKMVNEEVKKNISAIIKETVRETIKESQRVA